MAGEDKTLELIAEGKARRFHACKPLLREERQREFLLELGFTDVSRGEHFI